MFTSYKIKTEMALNWITNVMQIKFGLWLRETNRGESDSAHSKINGEGAPNSRNSNCRKRRVTNGVSVR